MEQAAPSLTSFAAQRELAGNHHYSTAYAAALAGGGEGADATGLPAKVCQGLRSQARAWLAADLKALAGQRDFNQSELTAVIARRLQHWKQDADLAAVREKDLLDHLPEAERDQWHQFWADVDALLKKTAPKE